ncbi:glycosyltransferase [Candidatus Roizmanbacteria bacterium]|nr:glycosyltransferase [Candidatus Roizmanbacteria bacterium]
MKIAIVHDQLREFGGAERVLVVLKEIYPQADVFTSTFDLNSLGEHKEIVKHWNVHVSWFGKIPLLNRLYSPLRFLTPLIWESFDFSKYDLVISSTGSWMCKGIVTKKPTIHISYIHHPPRYLYGYETAVEWQKHLIIKIYGVFINHFLRLWDYEASQKPDHLIANSIETQKRITKFYRRDSTVIYPPVNVPSQSVISNVERNLAKRDYFITVSRLARAKHVDLLIKAANKYHFNLKVVGVGRDMKYLQSIAGLTIEFLGNVSDKKLKDLYQNAKAFLFASIDEEFGIAPVEAMGFGLPVIAYASGGLKETVHEDVNGYLFQEQSEKSLEVAMKKLQSLSDEKYLDMRKYARKESEKYSEEVFKKKIIQLVNSKLLIGHSREDGNPC